MWYGARNVRESAALRPPFSCRVGVTFAGQRRIATSHYNVAGLTLGSRVVSLASRLSQWRRAWASSTIRQSTRHSRNRSGISLTATASRRGRSSPTAARASTSSRCRLHGAGVGGSRSWRWRFAAEDKESNLKIGTVLNDDRADWREAWSLFPGDVANVWHGALHAGEVAASLEAAGFAIRTQIIWDKTRLLIGRGDYHWQHRRFVWAVPRFASKVKDSRLSSTTLRQVGPLISSLPATCQRPCLSVSA